MDIRNIGLITAALLFIAVFNLPYGYYEFLRIVVCLSAGFFAYHIYTTKKSSVAFIFIGIAILFNPIAPIYLSKDTWITIDFISMAAFGFTSIYYLEDDSAE